MNIYNRLTEKGLFLLAFLSIFTSCKVQELNTKVYQFTHEEFKYPEDKFLKDKKNIGIAFSGGGSRSASLTTGQLRALNELGILDKVKYISAVSGGAWASICYSYLPENKNDKDLLGVYKEPKELTLQVLKDSTNGELIKSISNAYVMDRYNKYSKCTLLNGDDCKGDEIYANILREIFLDSIGLGENRYVGYDSNAVDSIIKRNSNRKFLKQNDFYTYNKKNKPFLIVNGIVIGKLWNSRKLPSMHLEMTPLYTGVSYYNELYKRKIGGGYLETFAIDNKFRRKVDEDHLIFKKRKNKFSLGDMMAITGNAAGTVANRIRIGSIFGLPEIRFISIPKTLDLANGSQKVKSREFPVSDGGNLENLGLIPLLKRKVKKIIVFVNSKEAIREVTEKNGDKTIVIDNSINRVFGIKIKDYSSSISASTLALSNVTSALFGPKSLFVTAPLFLYPKLDKDANKKFIINTNLLGNENNECLILAKKLYEKKINGKPLIYTAKYKVNRNPDYGIYPTKGKSNKKLDHFNVPINDKRDEVEITWVYNDGFDENYVDLLPNKVRYSYYQKGFDTGKYAFPHLPTWKTSDSFRAFDYETEWANLLSHFSSWVVMDNKEVFKDFVKD